MLKGLVLLLAACFLLAFSSANTFVRTNQIGYLSSEPKVALVLTDQNLNGQTFRVVKNGVAVFQSSAGMDRGRYGQFLHLYELNFTALNAAGRYNIEMAGVTSLPFQIGPDVYASLIPKSLTFFRVQRCGNTVPLKHAPCHLKDGFASGGWHDAGDYLKFVVTTGDALNLMLSAYDRNPTAFADTNHNRRPDVLDESLIGLEWIYSMWDVARNTLYYQVGDGRDHDSWRMPERDDANGVMRVIYACTTGKGANMAGKASASLALASLIWSDSQKPFVDTRLASRYLTAAKQIYEYGKKRPAAQPGHEFYTDSTWRDDMALAALELYRATGLINYLNDARLYAGVAKNAWTFDWGAMNGLAQYEIGRADTTYRKTAITLLKRDVDVFRNASTRNPFRATISSFYWGSASVMVGQALEMLWYEDLSGDSSYRVLAQQQRDYVLGGNPWGVCWINSAGTNWSRHPHHQIADLTGTQLIGFWNEGPDKRSDWQSYEIQLRNADAYTAFQTDAAVYHDDVEDYVTNEPTIFANALGLALLSWYRP